MPKSVAKQEVPETDFSDMPEVTEEEEEEEKQEEKMTDLQKVASTQKEPKAEEVDENTRQILMEIEMLQNNGRYRAEMLHQMQEINRALVVIAGVLVDLSGNGKK